MFTTAAVATGLTLTAKLWIAGGGLTGTGFGAGLHALYRYFTDDSKDLKLLEAQREEKKEEIIAHLDKTVSITENSTRLIQRRTAAQMEVFEQGVQSLAISSALWQEEGQNLSQLELQLKSVLTEQQQKLELITQQLQQQEFVFPALSESLSQSQLLLTERQNELETIIDLLRHLLSQLEARNKEWLSIQARLSQLEATNEERSQGFVRAKKMQSDLVIQVKSLSSRLEAVLETIDEFQDEGSLHKTAAKTVSSRFF